MDLVAVAAAVVRVDSTGVVGQLARQQRQYGLVGIADNPGIQPDARRRKRRLRPRADAAADGRVHAAALQKRRDGAVAAARGGDDGGVHNHAAVDGVDFELGAVAEVLADHPVIVCDCDFHMRSPFVWFTMIIGDLRGKRNGG